MRSAVSLFFTNKPFGEKGVFQQENTDLQIGPQLFFEEVASTITPPLIAEEEGINKVGVQKL